jgi:hypothetical protein
VSEDERALRERLAALENEVKAESAQKARKDAALDRLRAERDAKAAERAAASRPKAAKPERISADEVEVLPSAKQRRRAAASDIESIGNALELARKAQGVREELTRPKKKGDKSWKVSAVLSTAFGPLGWLYAGSWREAAPAGAAWLGFAYLASLVLPTILLLPLLMVLPLSGVAGALYALSYNRNGARQRLFGEDKPKTPKVLQPPDDEA